MREYISGVSGISLSAPNFIYFLFMPILSGLIEISVYSCGELRKAGSEWNIDMKKLVIILAIAIMLFATLKQRTEQPATVTEGTPLNAAAEQAEKVPETYTEHAKKTTEATCEPVPTEATEKNCGAITNERIR